MEFTTAAAALSLMMAHQVSPSVVRLADDGVKAVVYERSGLYPEGIDYDPLTGRTFLSSVLSGDISMICRDGAMVSFARDDRLISTIGLRVDSERRRLLVANSDYGVARKSAPETDRRIGGVAVFDLASGALTGYVDLAVLRPGAPIFLNDLDVDEVGNTYVTNSLSPVIYKITPEGQASVFVESERFAGQGFSLNGIRVHPDGYLLVAKKSDGSLFRVPLANPDDWTEVHLPERFIATDGILLAGNDLILLRNRTATVTANEVVLLRSDNDWSTARVVERRQLPDDYATTATVRGGSVWASEGRLHTLQPGEPADAQTFTLRRVATVDQ